MDINKYLLFADIAETGNFTRSGERMGYTQPGVSHIIKTMESELGFPLFIRTKSGLVLTRQAERLLPYVHELLAADNRLSQAINSIRALPPSALTIACYSSISRQILPAVIRRMQDVCPQTEIRLILGGPDEICRWLDDGTADLGLLSRRGLIEQLEWIRLFDDPMLAVLPSHIDSCRSNRSVLFSDSQIPNAVSLEVLTLRPFIISSLESNYDLTFLIHDSGIHPDILYSSQDDLAIACMVENDLGVSILPGLVLDGSNADILALPLNPHYSRELGIACRSFDRLSPAASEFIRIVQEVVPSVI